MVSDVNLHLYITQTEDLYYNLESIDMHDNGERWAYEQAGSTTTALDSFASSLRAW